MKKSFRINEFYYLGILLHLKYVKINYEKTKKKNTLV